MLLTGMTEITISIDAIVAFLAIIAASYFAYRQTSIMDMQRKIFERQRDISEYQKIYQGQQTTISGQQAELLRQQLTLIREQENDRKKREELFLLIAPLYTNFRKNYEIIEWMSLREISKIYNYRNMPSRKEALENLEAEILEIMRQRKGLAHEPLYSKINVFDNLLPNYQNNPSDLKALLKEIFELVRTRYDELIGQ
jgi:hypothetical protein